MTRKTPTDDGLPQPGSTLRTRLRRIPERAVHDRSALHAVLDAGLVAHVAVTDDDGQPYIVPVAYGRDGDHVLFHGSTASRLFRGLANGQRTCLTVTLLDGLVLARSLFESSMNYRGVMVLGTATKVTGPAKVKALQVITEHLLPGRWDEARQPSKKELAATLVLSLPLDEASVKIRDGGPEDPPEDVALPVWAGEIPIREVFGTPIDAADLAGGHRVPSYVQEWQRWSAVPTTDLRSISFWWDRLAPQTPRDPLDGDVDADVVIVGAGYTGLWTAYYLLEHQPSLKVVLLEAEVAGFGASGRNGGWCSALFPASWDKLARAAGRDGAIRMQQAMFDTVDEVGRVVADEHLDVDWNKGGSAYLARSPLQEQRAKDTIAQARAWSFGDEHFRYLDADEARKLVGATDVRAAVFTPDCAVIQPAKLVRQLADVVELRGATIYEHSPVTAVEPGLAHSIRGTVRAPFVVRATEGYTATLQGLQRDVAPVYSLMIATEPLPETVWAEIGLETRPTFNDFRHLVIYGQRTADGRFAFGGRGAPYHFRSNIQRGFDRDPAVFEMLWHTLTELFPAVAPYRVTHHWGGPLGVTRDWWASAGLDARTGIAWSGGYVGDGVGTSNLGGRTVADLILQRDSDLVALPWVDHRSRKWEPEPLRWLGVNTGLKAMGAADPEETRTGRPSVIAKAFNRLIHG